MSTKRVIFHFGAPKTSSSSLQAAFVRRRHELAEEGIIYPAMKSSGPERKESASGPFMGVEDIGDVLSYDLSHTSLFLGVRTRFGARKQFPEGSSKEQEIENSTAAWREEVAKFRASDAHTLIISSENQFMTSANYDMDLMREPLEGLPVTLVVALRHPEELLHGLYCTHVRGAPRTTAPPKKTAGVKRYTEGGYRQILTACTDALKPEHVIPFYVSDLWGSDRSLLGAFLERIGVDSKVEQDFHARPTLPTAEVLFLRKLNRRNMPKQMFTRVRKAIDLSLENRKAKRKTSVLSEKLQTSLNEIYAADAAWLNETYGVAPPKVVDKPVVPEKLNTTAEEDAEILARILPHMPEAMGQRLTKTVQKIGEKATAES